MPQNFMIKTGIIIIIMWKLLGLLFSASLVVAVPLDCESNLKLLYPEWFAHCNCSYSDWSEWQLVEESVVDVPTSQCDSGQAYSESRTRSALGDGCNLETQKRMICMPDEVDKLIEELGLGNNGPDTNANKLLDSDLVDRRQSPEYLCPSTGNNGFICTGSPYSNGKRSLGREFRPTRRSPKKRSEPAPLPFDPIPYNRHEHGARFRRQSNSNCHPNGEQYVLFLLDTSGSIGSSNFEKIKTAVGKLTLLFCNRIHVAVMTYSHTFRLEFCFNCFGSDLHGLLAAKAAIEGIPYRGGLSYTGGAAKCACDELLQPKCGMHRYANCIDVVFITDGGSNDPNLEVCEEVRCLHNHYTGGVNTHSIGIGGANQAELDCIEHVSHAPSAFSFDTFQDFLAAINEVIIRLRTTSYQCYTPT